MKALIVTRPEYVQAPERPAPQLCAALREGGLSVDIASEESFDREAPGDIVFWEYPGGTIEPATIDDADEYAAAYAKVIAPIPPARVLLFNSPRNRDSIIIPSRLGLAGSIDSHDLWTALTPGMLNKQPWYESGIVGRTDILVGLGCAPVYEEGPYAKVPVKPFPSLPSLLNAYLERYLAWLGDR